MRAKLPALSDYKKYRFLEILPGLMMWSTFVLAIGGSFVAPILVIYFIIVFDLYWFLRIIYMAIFMLISFRRYRQAVQTDWQKKLAEVPGGLNYYHLVFYPTFKESYEVLRGSLLALQNNHYPLDRFIVVLAGEERDKGNFTNIAERLEQEFGAVFFHFMATTHPATLPGELAGKGSNLNWAGRQAKHFIDSRQLDYDHIIVSSFDADTCVHPDYFTHLTYVYASHPRPTRASYQPLAVFNNNIWEAPPVTRIISYSTTFWLMTDQSRPERLFSFSSHSMSFRALVDVDFWQSDTVTEDSRISMQCVMEYDGAYEVVPTYIPVSMDVVLGNTFWQTLKAQYIQQRRWAYSVENFAYMVWNFGRNKNIPFLKKFRYIFNQIEGIYSWATAPMLIFALGFLPIWVANWKNYTSVVAQNAPALLQILMSAAMGGLMLQSLISIVMLPKRPLHYPKWKLSIMVLQWILIPVTLILFGSFPAIDAQTRLMLGKYLGFNVTEKVRKLSR